MLKTIKPYALYVTFGLAIAGCLKPEGEATGTGPASDTAKPAAGLDAGHGGARIALPEIDFASLAKAGTDSSTADTAALAYFELSITGANMREMSFQYPLRRTGGQTFEIQGIPSGEKRAFSGRLLTRDSRLTHAGITVADIRPGTFSDIRLYLAKASGSANVCVVVEGQKPPACALDTLPPPPLPGSCWYVSSDSVSGMMSLYPQSVDGYMGVILTTDGNRLPLTTWLRSRDSLTVIVVRASMDRKWRLSGPVSGNVWIADGIGEPMESPFLLHGRPSPCGDTVVVPPKDTVTPPKDTVRTGAIPAAGSAGEVTLCFEMRFDYADRCGLSGHAKMSFFAGQITRGNISVADRPGRFYHETRGNYDRSPDKIRIETIMPVSANTGVTMADTLVMDGTISLDRTQAKGETLRLPAGKKGIWTMASVPCGNWTPTYPDSTCFAPPVTAPPADTTKNLALTGKVSASSFWEDNPLLKPENARDGSNWDTADAGNYWNLPNQTKGWWQVDLGRTHPLRLVRIFNTSNSYCNDRGTKDFRLEIRDSADAVVRTQRGTLDFVDYYGGESAKIPLHLDLKESVNGRYVKVYVDSWYPTRTDTAWPYRTCASSNPSNEGGGLNEVQVYAAPASR